MKAKRMIAVLLLLSLCLALSACSTGSSVGVLGVTYPTTPLDTASGGSAAQSDDAIAAGEVYRNEYFKFTCNLSDEWYVLNTDELSQMLGITYEALGDGTAGKLIQTSFETGSTQMDFYAVMASGGETINVVLSKAKVAERLLPDQLLLKASVPLLTSGLTDMGATNISSDTKELTFLGDQRFALIVQADYQGMAMQETIFLIRESGYIASITITDISGNPTDDYADYFQVIE